MGKAIKKYPREKIILATKFGIKVWAAPAACALGHRTRAAQPPPAQGALQEADRTACCVAFTWPEPLSGLISRASLRPRLTPLRLHHSQFEEGQMKFDASPQHVK